MGYELAQSFTDLRAYLDSYHHPDKWMAFDTETTGLNTRKAKLVGFSISLEAETGIYVPVGHQIGNNLPKELALRLVQKKLDQGYTVIYHNAKYDRNIMQVASKWVPEKFEDTLEFVYLADPDRKGKGLKDIAKVDFGVDMTRFEDLFTPEEIKAKNFDISTKSPKRCVDYACADADFTLRIREKYDWVSREQSFALKIDHELIDIVRKIEHNGGMELNKQYILSQLERLEKLSEALANQIHRIIGYQFDITSPKQLGDALFESFGVPSLGMTRGKNPQHKTDAEVLSKLADQFPVCEYVVSYKKVVKASGTYFKKLKRLIEADIPIRFNFNIFAAPTFRFSAPGGAPEVDGATGVNIQAVSNGEFRDIVGVDLSVKIEPGRAQGTYDLDEDDSFFESKEAELKVALTKSMDASVRMHNENKEDLPWVLPAEKGLACIRETCNGCPANCADEGIDVTRRLQKDVAIIPSVRESFQAPDGWVLVSFDYDRQELVIGANLSKEPRWLKALANGVDLHAMTAATAFGISDEAFAELPKPERETKRRIGKVINFATFYGATGYTIAQKANIAIRVGEMMFDGFVRKHPTLFSWMNKVHIFSRREGYTTTYFGRKRWLKQFYEGDRRMQAFADRSAVNTAIQGTGAEITRIAMVRVVKKLKKAGLEKKIKMVMQLHDELTFLIRDDVVWTGILLIKSAMEFEIKSWEVQLTVGCKMGKVWGQQKEVDLEDVTREVKFH